MNAKVKNGWCREGQTCLVLGNNVFVEQWWTPVKWEDEDEPTFYKTAALENVESQNSTSTNTERGEISALIKKTLNDLDHGCGPHIRDFIADLQKLSPVS